MTTTANATTVEQIVADALDRLPEWVLDAIADVPVLVLNGGDRTGAYGLYHGDGVAHHNAADRIVIYRDTLQRDFGRDPDALAREVEQTLRHEIAHHLGYHEAGVAALGL